MKKPPKTRDEQKLEIVSGRSINPDAITPDMEPSGSDKPLLLVAGEAPGENEDSQGVQFVGLAGSLLRKQFPKWIEKDIRWNNAVRTRPVTESGANRTPTQEEIDFYAPSLRQDIADTKPKVILTTGAVPLNALLPGVGNITLCRGRKFPADINGHKCWVFPILHPSYILRVQNFRGGDIPGIEQKRFWSVEIQRAISLAESEEKPVVYDVEKFKKNIGVMAWSSLSPVQIRNALSEMKPPIAFDFETSTFRPYADGARIICMGFSDGERTVSFPFQPSTPFWSEHHLDLLKSYLKDFFFDGCEKVAHNLNFELEWLVSLFGPKVARASEWRCTEAESFILDERVGGHDLDFCSRLNLGFSVKSLSSINMKKIDSEPIDVVCSYNGMDAKATALLDKVQLAQINKDGMQEALHDQIERIPTLVLAQARGLEVSQERVKSFSVKLGQQIEEIKSRIQSRPEAKEYKSRFEEDYLPTSVPRTVKLLRDVVGIQQRSEKFSTDKEALKELTNVPMAKLLLDFRELTKLKGTYIDSMVPGEMVWPDGRIHPIFNSTKTVTGRLSSKHPNCFPSEVEVLTKRGWKKWNSVTSKDSLAQYDFASKDISFASPTSLISYEYNGDLIRIKTEEQIDIRCTPDHVFLLVNRKTASVVKTEAKDYPEDYKQLQAGFFVGGNLDYSAEQLIAIAALQADGSVTKYGNIDWKFSKARKINRLSGALDSLSITYRRTTSASGQTRIVIKRADVPSWLEGKKLFGDWILDLNKSGFQFLAEEIWFWDGCLSRRSMYSSSERSNADWAQILTALSGRRAKVRLYRYGKAKEYYKDNWQVDASSTEFSLTTNRSILTEKYSGTVHCATMPKGTVIVRHNDRVAIAGNCQNYPARRNKEVRSIVVADKNSVFVACDYSQIEARLIAMVSRDSFLMKATKEGYDIHAEWANRIKDAFPSIYKRRGSDFKKFRSEIKNELVFPLFYGSQPSALAARLEIPENKAKGVFDEFWRMFPGVLRWQKELMQAYRSLWYVTTMNGRRRRAPMSPNMVYNSLIQGSASDLVVDAMNRLSSLALSTEQPWLQAVLNIHDDLTFCIPEVRLEDALERIIEEMTTFRFPWVTLPIEIEVSVGPDWGSMKPIGKFQTSPLTPQAA